MTTSLKTCWTLAVLMFVCGAGAFAQPQTDKDRAAQQAIKALHAREIPEATLQCTSDEAAWWNDVRAAGKAIKESRGAQRESEKFINLIKHGIENAYQIPVPDRNAIVLWRAMPQYTEEARRRKLNGSVALAVELLPGGTVGEVKIAESLDPGLDQMAVNAARKLVFLPAIKQRSFVSSWVPMTMSFNIY